MSYTYEKIENSKVKVAIQITQKDWENALEKSYQENCGKFKVQGFRQGKAPRKVIEKQYGEGVFFDDALNIAFAKEYYAFLDNEKDIEPIENPDVKVEKFDENGISLTATVCVLPEIKLGQYKGLGITKQKPQVDEKEINDELERVRARNARYEEVADRESKMGDIVTIDFEGSVDGVKFEGGAAKDYRLELGSKSFIPGFEEQVAGMKVGEEKDINVKFPDDYQATDLAGKDSVFAIKLNKIEQRILPELDDEFASNASEFETLAEYKQHIKEHILEHKAEHANYDAENKLIQTIVDASEVVVPETLIEKQCDAFLKDFEARLGYQGIKLEDYAKYTNTTVEDMRNSRRDQAENTVKTRLVLEEIIKKENLFVSQEELDEVIAQTAAKYKKTLDAYKKQLTDRDVAYYENQLLMDKLLKFLKENNTITEE